MAHFQMSTGGSKSNEHVDHFLVDIHILIIQNPLIDFQHN